MSLRGAGEAGSQRGLEGVWREGLPPLHVLRGVALWLRGGGPASRVVSEQCVLLGELLTAELSERPAGTSLECGEACFVSASTSASESQRRAQRLGGKTEARQVLPV